MKMLIKMKKMMMKMNNKNKIFIKMLIKKEKALFYRKIKTKNQIKELPKLDIGNSVNDIFEDNGQNKNENNNNKFTAKLNDN